jgi:hypothetical protein
MVEWECFSVRGSDRFLVRNGVKAFMVDGIVTISIKKEKLFVRERKGMAGLENKLVLNLEEASSTLSLSLCYSLKGFTFSLFWLLREDAMTATDICFSV